MGKFVIKAQKDGQFYFNLVAGNGQNILKSEAYKTKASCINGINSVKKNAADEKRFERKESKTGKPFFNLKAGNGQVIGTSELYETEAARENGIASVQKNAPEATTEDTTA
ncbi:MAG: YegP family protein [Chitinophagales bacterium]|nr:YegP family protein [Bacteroidota bacterium]